MIIRTPEERTTLIEAGRRLGVVLDALAEAAKPGVTSEELDALSEKLIRDGDDEPSFLNYTPEGAARPYPASLCISINDAVVHGIPNEPIRTLKIGDLVGLDLGLTHRGMIVDSALTVSVGHTDKKGYALMAATAAALEAAMVAAQPGARVGDISHAIEMSLADAAFTVVKALCGHGVGAQVHEEPMIPNAGRSGTGEKLVQGMVIAIEPIANEGRGAVVLASDGYTFRTKDGSRSAHFEHTIVIEEKGPLVVTRRPSEQ